MVEDTASPALVRQRIRNRIIEYLELASSFEDQAEYQADVPYIHVPSEVINQWEDWVDAAWREYFVAPVFDDAEREAVRAFQEVWSDACDSTPDSLPDLDTLFGDPQWARLRDAARDALAVFRRRGALPDDVYAF